MKKILIILSCLFLSGCLTTNQQKGQLLGGVLGGIIHQSNTPLSLLGVIAGAWVGGELGEYVDDTQPVYISQKPHYCDKYINAGEVKACKRGVEKRNRQQAKEQEKEAFYAGYESQ